MLDRHGGVDRIAAASLVVRDAVGHRDTAAPSDSHKVSVAVDVELRRTVDSGWAACRPARLRSWVRRTSIAAVIHLRIGWDRAVGVMPTTIWEA